MINKFKLQNRLLLLNKHLGSKKHMQFSDYSTEQLEVLQRKNFAARIFVLNRPKALNSLNLNMVRLMYPQLKEWENSELCKLIILKSSSDKAFCAGGDVKNLMIGVKSGKIKEGIEFFKEEYELDYLISSLSTPVVSFINGITMGGGVGLSIHTPFRIATEKTLFSMPETTIGLFPDVGTSYHLSRMDNNLGKYLSLTSKKLKGIDTYFTGISTHFVSSERVQELEDRLCEIDSNNKEQLDSAIEDYTMNSIGFEDYSLKKFLPSIERCFRHSKISDIIKELKMETENVEWAKETLNEMQKMSPSSLIITLSQLEIAKSLNIKQCFELDYHLVRRRIVHEDLYEGVNALLIKKTKAPIWSPKSIEDVNQKEIIEEYFGGFNKNNNELIYEGKNSENKANKSNYGIIREKEIKDYVKSNNNLLLESIVRHFVIAKNGKLGTEEVVNDVVSRKCRLNNGIVQWKEE